MSKITRNDVEHVARLARLRLTDTDLDRFTKDLDAIFTHMDQLGQLDTTNVPPTSHILGVSNVMREDVVGQSLPREEVLRNAPAQQDGQFKVPAVLTE